MHIAPFDNHNKPIVDVDDATVPLNYFNIVKLKKGQAFEYAVPGYETCIVPATGTVDVTKYHDKVGRLLVSELFTVGAGGWSGFPGIIRARCCPAMRCIISRFWVGCRNAVWCNISSRRTPISLRPFRASKT